MFETRIVDMADLRDVNKVCDCVASPNEGGKSSKQKRKRGPAGIKEITRVSSKGRRRVVKYNELGRLIGENATKLKSFIGTTEWFHISITYSNWPTVPKEIKDKTYELIEVKIQIDISSVLKFPFPLIFRM